MRYSVSSRRSSCEGSLYEKCMKEQSQKKHKIDKKIREKEDQELSLCTYHP